MCCNCCGGDCLGGVDLCAEVDGLIGGVVVVGESAVDGAYGHVVDAILAEHHGGYLGT